MVHGITASTLESTIEILLRDDWSSFILSRIAAGKKDGNDADADNKKELMRTTRKSRTCPTRCQRTRAWRT